MDPRRFEAVSRRIASAATRREALGALAGGLAAALGVHGAEAGGGGGLPIVRCKAPGQHCQRDVVCCSKRCVGGICSCSQKGRQCWTPLEGALCCSGRCHKGKCK